MAAKAKERKLYADSPAMQHILSQWENIDRQGMMLVCPFTAITALCGYELPVIQQWIDRHWVLSTSLVNLRSIEKQRKCYRGLKRDGHLFSGMPEELGIVLDVPPQNILRAVAAPMRGRSRIDQQKFTLSDNEFFSVDRSGIPSQAGADANVVTPQTLMKATRWQHNEILVMGRTNQNVHGVFTERVIAKDIVILSKRTQSALSEENQKLWLGFHVANYYRCLPRSSWR
ncbi:MAG: hypothetical protein LBJ33_05910 [Pseudomonas putida]|jgi:hypothetical protein|nr:hypothetical protein [Pseudomonas putida]